VNGLVGSLVGLGATKGVFVAISAFSQELAELMIEHGVGVRSYRTVEFKRLDEDFFGED
jgi:restriction system protein